MDPVNYAVTWSRRPGDSTVTWSRRPGDSTVTWSRRPGDSTVTLYPESVNIAEHPEHGQSRRMQLIKLIFKFISLLLNVIDMGSDSYSAYKHISNSDYWWGSFTIVFAVLPIVSGCTGLIIYIFQKSEKPVLVKFLLALATIVCALIVPFGILLWNVVESLRRYTSAATEVNADNDDDEGNDADIGAGLMKICEALLESYPQASLQIYIVFQTIVRKDNANMNDIGTWQWLTIGASLIALAFSVSTSDFFAKAAIRSRITFFIFGLLAVTSRLVVACVYSMEHKLLWYVPISTELASSIFMWSIIRWCRCSTICVQLIEEHRSCALINIVQVVFTWVLTASYNCVTLSGLVMSTISLGFAVGGFFLPHVPQYLAIIAITLASVSWVANIILTAVPRFRSIREDWLHMDADGMSGHY